MHFGIAVLRATRAQPGYIQKVPQILTDGMGLFEAEEAGNVHRWEDVAAFVRRVDFNDREWRESFA